MGALFSKGPNWLELPIEVTTNILQKVDTIEVMTSASQVCSLWWNICKDPLMWRAIDMTILKIGHYCDYPKSRLLHICRCAVRRSCGHLEDIAIDCFATNDLLKFIADRTSRLRRIRLARCIYKALLEFLSKYPSLEELDISMNSLHEDTLEAIGRCCPHLKVLKFNKSESLLWDEEALAIAKSMSELRHLQITVNSLRNKALLAILNGCPLLVSLDLRACSNVDWNESLGKRCREKIKDLRLPCEALDKLLDDYPSSDTESYYDDSFSHFDYEVEAWTQFDECYI